MHRQPHELRHQRGKRYSSIGVVPPRHAKHGIHCRRLNVPSVITGGESLHLEIHLHHQHLLKPDHYLLLLGCKFPVHSLTPGNAGLARNTRKHTLGGIHSPQSISCSRGAMQMRSSSSSCVPRRWILHHPLSTSDCVFSRSITKDTYSVHKFTTFLH